jgi:hypothetical protein
VPVDPANAHELAQIASEIDADSFQGAPRHRSDAGGWLARELSFRVCLERCRLTMGFGEP